MPAAHQKAGVPPPWVKEITDWALNEALLTRTFSSPWQQALLQVEKQRRDQWQNIMKPAWVGGVFGAVAGALVSWMLAALASKPPPPL